MGGLLLMFEPGAMSHRNVGVHGRGKWQSKQSARQGLRDPTPFGQQLRIRRSRHSQEAQCLLHREQLSKCPWGACVSTPEGTDESGQCRRLQRQASKASEQRRSTRSRGARDVEGVM